MNHKFVALLQESLLILSVEDYEKEIILPDKFLGAYLWHLIDKESHSKGYWSHKEGINVKSCLGMSAHLKALSQELESYACCIGQAQECSDQMEYEEQLIKQSKHG
jgi:hypothetical protein